MRQLCSLLVLFGLFIPLGNAQIENNLFQKISELVEDLKQASDRGYALLPIETKLIEVEPRDHHLIIYLDIPLAFLEKDMDDLILDEITEHLVSPLSDEEYYYVAVKARNRKGQFVNLSSFISQLQLAQVTIQSNKDPLQGEEGQLSRRNIFGKNSVQKQGALQGKTVWLSAGHGWQYDGRRRTFNTQRRNSFGVVEDFASIEFVNYHLLKYLHQAGADVWTVRERDMNTREVIVDNDDGAPFYKESGSWATSRTRGYDGRTYRYAISSRNPGTTATYQPLIPASGLYWVSVWYLNGLNRTVDARYEVHHAGGVSTVSINQEVHGNTWVYLGQFYFEKGSEAKVILNNQSYEKGQAVIADAVRFGGGMGNIADCHSGKKSGEPRFEEGAKYYAKYQGFSNCINDVMVRPAYAEWELSKGTKQEKANAIYLSLHTNGSGSSGTETYIHGYRPVRGSRTLQQFIHREMISDIRKAWDNKWRDRGEKAADFGELRGLRTMPGVLIEIGFHDHPSDAQALTTPAFRNLAARSIYKGVVRYFAQKTGERPVFLPEPPNKLMAYNDGLGQVTLEWHASSWGGVYGDQASNYKVFISKHGRAFVDHEITNKTSFSFKNLEAGTTYYFRVAAVNDGGESFPSAVVAVRTPQPGQESLKYLLVDGFDRLDRSISVMVYEAKPHFAPLGNVRRLFLEQMNDYSYASEHGSGMSLDGIYFDGIDNDALENHSLKLSEYNGINWFLGRESVIDEALSFKERALLKSYLDGGGRLVISGSELAYHLDFKGHGMDFYHYYLKAKFKGDNARSSNFLGNNNSNFRGLNGHFRSTEYGAYPVASPDYLLAIGGGEAVLKYSNGETAAVGYVGEFGILNFAFPLEMVQDKKLRQELIFQSLQYLHNPEIKPEKPSFQDIAKIRN